MRRFVLVLAVTALAAGVLAGCGDDDGSDEASTPSTKPASSAPAPVEVTARDYAFDVPESIPGGLVELEYRNVGKEPHFAGLIKLAEGRTVDDVGAFFGAPPSGPPPFTEVGGLPTTDPGGAGNQVLNLEPGDYAFFCAIPSPDGQPHIAKGMIEAVEVTEGEEGDLPRADAVVEAVDFGYGRLPSLEAGETVVELENNGTQLHEINLIEIEAGKTVDDVTAWLDSPAGPPPVKFLAGAAIEPNSRTTTRLRLESGSRYAFICAIPDPADGKPHYAKGMKSPVFEPH